MSEHRVIYERAVTASTIELVCSCGAMVTSFGVGLTPAAAFALHVRRAAPPDPPILPPGCEVCGR